MSKIDRKHKTRMLREKRNPQRRIEHITELRRNIKFYKSLLPQREKDLKELERKARWARFDHDHFISEIARMEKDLVDYEAYNESKKG